MESTSTVDLVLTGGTVVDGTGAPGRMAAVAMANGRIVFVGDQVDAPPAKRTIGVDGLVVAPGFIDIHTHYDAQVFWDGALSPSCYHGVTSVVAGNCGFSIAPTRPEHRDTIARTLENVEDMNVESLREGVPWDFETFDEYLASVDRSGFDLNYGAYIGHTAVRLFVMGDDAYERAATTDEVAAMVAVVESAMREGAVGFASSFGPTHLGVDGKPVPSRHASIDEFEALASVVGRFGAGVVGVVPGDPVSRELLYELQPRIGAPITYGALLTRPTGSHLDELALNRRGRAAGADVWPQVTPRPIAFSITMRDPFILNPNPVFGELMGGTDEARLAAYAEPAWRDRATDEFAKMTRLAPRWDTYVFGESPSHPELIGRRVADVARERGVSELDIVCDIAIADRLDTRITCIVANDDEAGVTELLLDAGCTLGLSDAGAHVGQICDAVQSTEFLGAWVRDRALMPLEQAVRRLTGQQADLFGFAERGYLRAGAAADVVVFDPATIAPGPVRRVRDFPANAERLTADQPAGVHHVFVNGEPIRLDEQQLDHDPSDRPGRRLRPTKR